MRWELFSMLINRGLRLTGVYRCWRSYTNERLNGLPTSSSSSRLVARQSTATSGPAPVTMSTGGCQADSSSENLGNSEPLPHRNLDVCVNILVEEDERERLTNLVRGIVDPSRYIVYPIKLVDLGGSGWMSGCRLLILTSHNPQESSLEAFRKSGGRVINLDANNCDREGVEGALAACHIQVTSCATSNSNCPDEEGATQECRVGAPTLGYLISSDQNALLDHANIKSRLTGSTQRKGETKLIFCAPGSPESSLVRTLQRDSEAFLVKPIESRPDGNTFGVNKYREVLKTEHIGRHLLHFPLISSSMLPLEGAALVHGITIVPDQQTAGRGRGSNRWLSPPGCAMFSLQLHLSLATPLGRRPSILQHILGLAVVSSLRNYESKLDIRLKWPNDIYFQNKVKLGGIIVTSSVFGSRLVVNLGCGLNLENTRPTLSINQLLAELGRDPVSREQYLAHTFNTLETLIDRFNKGGDQDILKEYYSVWLHTDQQVKLEGLQDHHQSSRVRIIGLDEFGFLEVEDDQGSVFSVHDDGNSFDMMAGLIKPKLR